MPESIIVARAKEVRPMRYRTFVSGLAAVGVALTVWSAAPAVASGASAGGGALLPDLRTMRRSFFHTETLPGGTRLLSFGNTVADTGTGPLELHPRIEDCDQNGNFQDDRTAYQRIFRDANDDGYFTRGVDTVFQDRVAGCFTYDPAHGHWHFQDYARYDLRAIPDGTLIRTNTKVGFCLVDTDHLFPGLPGSPSRPFFLSLCGSTDTQGISIGWADTYSPLLPRQWIDITGVPDGDYCFVSTADPDDLLVELDSSNNSASRPLHLDATSVHVLPGSC